MSSKTKILIISADAGGGHTELRKNLVRTFGENQNVEIKEYHSDQKAAETAYKIALSIPYFWDTYSKYINTKYLRHINKYLVMTAHFNELKELLEKEKPDVVIGTFIHQNVTLLHLRKKFNFKFKFVACIYDYGNQLEEIPLTEKSDYYLVRDEYTKNFVKRYVDEDKILIFGTSVGEIFTELAGKDKNEIGTRFQNVFSDVFSDKKLDPSKKNILIIGGANWAYKSESLINKLVQSNKYNVFVSCGRDEKFFTKIKDKLSILAFKFIPQEKLATLEAFVDLTILSSIAPATLNELMELHKYPIIVHRHLPGQEAHHISLLIDWNIGLFEPKVELMIKLIEEYFENPEKFAGMIESQKRIRKEEKEKCKRNNEIIKIITS